MLYVNGSWHGISGCRLIGGGWLLGSWDGICGVMFELEFTGYERVRVKRHGLVSRRGEAPVRIPVCMVGMVEVTRA